MSELKSKLSDDCTLHVDYDQVAFQSAASVEKHTIKTIHKGSGRSMKFNNVTEFWGRGKSITGWLGEQNTKREESGAKVFSKDDFLIEDIYVSEPVNYATQAAKSRVHSLCKHLGVGSYDGVLGESNTFRHKLLLPQFYKGQRSEHKPLHLPDVRDYLIIKHNGSIILDIEADDALTKLQYKGWKNYQKTGKITDIVGSIDKDSLHTSGFLFNFNKSDGKLLHPEVIVIDDGIGNIWDDGKKGIKGFGSYWLAYQLLIGDSTDNIRVYQDFGIKYGEKTFYKEVSDIRSQAELFSFVKDKYTSWFPNGVKFTAWNGEQVEMSSSEWLETIFKLIYMHRVDNDPTTFHKMLDFYKRKENRNIS